ncbi:Uncharacterized protein family UPF0503 [Vigna unguiculata]|uniref:Uncharacterized protein family UPF0503 n=1 Tax=Vigna unguiculata TaxID=3917 RepID=A0A4D6N8N9_VIGUN|nr:Uncharacterized protein family UPF0503 [Vigna unguiculata]
MARWHFCNYSQVLCLGSPNTRSQRVGSNLANPLFLPRDYKSKKPTNRHTEIRSGSAGVEIGESERGDTVRVSGDEDGEGKTMKEFIDLELWSRKGAWRDFKDIAASFCGLGSPKTGAKECLGPGPARPDAKKGKKPTNRHTEIRSGSAGVEIGESERGDTVRVSGDEDGEGKTMKEFIDLELWSRKGAWRDFKDIAASFCGAASEFSKRLMNWKRKLNPKRNHRHSDVAGANVCSVEKLGFKSLRETQSEVGEYNFTLGRRSCDTDPRLSVDESRFSSKAPRASWDGSLIGKAYHRVSPMVRVGDKVLVGEEEKGDVTLENGEECCPGGSTQMKHYYSDWHRRRRSFDRSNSRRKSIMGDVDELRVISNDKVSPATTELFYGAKVLIIENSLRDVNLKSSDSVMGSGSKVDACDVAIEDGQQGLNKFHSRLWSKLGLLQRRREDMLGEGDYGGGDVDEEEMEVEIMDSVFSGWVL